MFGPPLLHGLTVSGRHCQERHGVKLGKRAAFSPVAKRYNFIVAVYCWKKLNVRTEGRIVVMVTEEVKQIAPIGKVVLQRVALAREDDLRNGSLWRMLENVANAAKFFSKSP